MDFFQILALIATSIGVFSTLVFHALLKSSDKKLSHYRRNNRTFDFEKILKFCKSVQLYQVAVVFTACKLLINIALIYIPLFINESAIDESGTIASIPLVAYLSSLVTSVTAEYVKPCFRSDKVSCSTYPTLCSVGLLGALLNFCSRENTFRSVPLTHMSLIENVGLRIHWWDVVRIYLSGGSRTKCNNNKNGTTWKLVVMYSTKNENIFFFCSNFTISSDWS